MLPRLLGKHVPLWPHTLPLRRPVFAKASGVAKAMPDKSPGKLAEAWHLAPARQNGIMPARGAAHETTRPDCGSDGLDSCGCRGAAAGGAPPFLAARDVAVDGVTRTFIVHVPPKLDLKMPSPVVLNFHGAWANARVQVALCGLNRKADEANFVAVYPNGSGADERRLFWNAFGPGGGRSVDDVKFVAANHVVSVRFCDTV